MFWPTFEEGTSRIAVRSVTATRTLLIIINVMCGSKWAGIATRYELDSPGIESRWGARFSAPVQTGLGAYPASYTIGTGFLSRG